jgi:hypothetical protein
VQHISAADVPLLLGAHHTHAHTTQALQVSGSCTFRDLLQDGWCPALHALSLCSATPPQPAPCNKPFKALAVHASAW